ncbi:putative spike protein [Aeromonas phage Gekk3-15]
MNVRLAKIPAWQAKALMDGNAEVEEWASWGEILVDGTWRRFSGEAEIDGAFDDWVKLGEFGRNMIAYNIGFMNGFSFHRVPASFDGVVPKRIDPMFHAVMACGYASMSELRTIYSLEDVFLMLDSITTTRLNEKIAMDAAQATANGGF